MKVIKTFFDEEGYEAELASLINQRKAIPAYLVDYMYSPTRFYDEAVKTVDKTKYERRTEFQYLNAVVDEGEPKLIVYNDDEGVMMIDRKNVKILP